MAKGSGPTSSSKPGGKPGGIGKYFDKALYQFEYPYRGVSAGDGTLPPSDPRADINDLTASATPPAHRRCYDPRVGGYYRFTAANSTYFTLASDVADAASEVFFAALVRKRSPVSASNLIMSRGDSMYMYMDATVLQFNVFTTSGGVMAQVINVPMTLHPGKWYLVTGAYKSGSYVKVGIDGCWVGTTTFAQTGLRNNANGISIGRDVSPAYGEHDIAFVGIGTAIPTDRQLKHIAYTIMNGLDVPGGGGDDPGGGGDPPPTVDGLHRMLLLGAG